MIKQMLALIFGLFGSTRKLNNLKDPISTPRFTGNTHSLVSRVLLHKLPDIVEDFRQFPVS